MYAGELILKTGDYVELTASDVEQILTIINKEDL